jgi:hypothetical protein
VPGRAKSLIEKRIIMPSIHLSRRNLLLSSGTALLVAPWLKPLSASEVRLPAGSVQFRPEIEPLVRLIEETPLEQLFSVIAARIKSGTTYTELLTATLLAGIRNVQPRPNVGFKFHCVMVMHAAHQATLAAKDEHRWFPLFWSLDYFKRCQDQDRNEGDWTMSAIDGQETTSEQAIRELTSALDQWDVEKADLAAANAARSATPAQLLEVFARFGARDFRNIGHKAIWVAGGFRTLEVIGWQHAEPVMRSLAYALLNHNGEPNPAKSDLAADRAGKANWDLVTKLNLSDSALKVDDGYAQQWLEAARSVSPTELATLTLEGLNQGISPRSIADGIYAAASELVMRQPAIVPLHAITASNALQYLYRSVQGNELRQWLLLQNASFIGHFRESASGRGELKGASLLELTAAEKPVVDMKDIFSLLGENRQQASQAILRYIQDGQDLSAMLRYAREMIFLKGTDSHDYKYSSAIFEDFRYCSPAWQAKVLAASSHLLTSSSQSDNGLKARIEEAFA